MSARSAWAALSAVASGVCSRIGPCVLALAGAVSLAACSPADRPTDQPTALSSPVLDGCLTGPSVQIMRVPDGNVVIGLIGSGFRVVVLANQSDENLCAWLPFSATLTRAGYRVAVWDYANGAPPGSCRPW